MTDERKAIMAKVESLEKNMVDCLSQCVKIPALGPTNGGKGESEKAEYLKGVLDSIGFDEVKRFDVPDDRVPTGKRPNMMATLRGASKKRLWVISHMDIVPSGDLAHWSTDPFQPVVKDGKIFGRGTEDNGQDLVASLFAAKALKDLGIVPELTLTLLLAADEETGSEKGVKWMMEKKTSLFSKDDYVMVPDAASPDGSLIEVAEKSILHLKVRTIGKQVHGSTPGKGINAHHVSAQYIVEVHKALHDRFPMKDPLFFPPTSTFEVTKKEANIPNINTIPGEDVVYFDNRVLPGYRVDDVLKAYDGIAEKVSKKTGARIDIDTVQRDDAAPATSVNDEITRMTVDCVKEVYDNKPKCIGIGGGTYAAMFRRNDIPAVVWCKGDEVAHMPNEYCIIKNMVGDAKVFALMTMTKL